MYILTLVLILALSGAWEIYKSYFKRMKKFKHFEERAKRYEARKEYQKAIDIRHQALNLANLSKREHDHLILAIGGTYLYLNNPTEATKYFDDFFEAVQDMEFPYDKQYRTIVQAYVDCGRKSDAKKVLESLIARQSYDKRFKRFVEFFGDL